MAPDNGRAKWFQSMPEIYLVRPVQDGRNMRGGATAGGLVPKPSRPASDCR